MIRVCFVCLGNICRSPTAEAVFRRLVQDARLGKEIEVESAGTGGYHVGEQADPRARIAAKHRGYELIGRARQFSRHDFERFDFILAMDQETLKSLRKASPNLRATEKIRLLRSYDKSADAGAEVPDPYYGGPGGFDEVIDICERACRGLLNKFRKSRAQYDARCTIAD